MARINWGRAPGILTEEEEARQLIENQRRWKGYGKTIMDLLAPNQNLQPSAHDLARQTIEINRPLGYTGKQPGKGGAPTTMYGVPQRVRGLGTGSESYKPAGPRGGQLTGPMAENPLVPARQTPMKEEEDEYGFLDAMFLANLVAGMQGGPPPTPYGFAVGGGNRSFVSLPTMGRTV